MGLPAFQLRSPQPFDPARYVPIGQAATLLGNEVGHLARLCREKLFPQGLAMQGVPPEGGQPRWFIHRDYDARLIPGPIGLAHQDPDLAGYSKKQQDMARQRRACVERLREARKSWPGYMRDWMPRLLEQLAASFPELKISRSQLYGWDLKYSRPSELVKLIDTRGGNTRGQSDPAAWSAFKDLFLHENQPSVKFCWQRVAELAKENRWKWVGLKACHAQLNDRIPPEVQVRNRQPAVWRSQLRPTIGQDPESWQANQCWIGDHKQLDLWCTWRDTLIRPWLTTWLDWRTRRVSGWVLSDNPNSSTILAALRHGLLDPRNLGGPQAVWIDNGRDYDAWVFHGRTKRERQSRMEPAVKEGTAAGIFTALKIEAHFSVPFNPNGKSRLERWFRTLESFCKTFDSYAGFSVATRPERLNEVLKALCTVPTFETVKSRIGQHIDGYNAQPDHDRDDMKDGGERLSPR